MEASEPAQGWWDIFDEEFPDQVKHSDVEYSFNWAQHNMNITDWDPGSKYKIVGYLKSEGGDLIKTDTLEYTHPEVDVLPLVGFQYYTVWVAPETITSTSAKLRSWTTENCTIQIVIGKSKDTMVEYPTNNEINASNPSYWQHGRTVEGLDPDTTYYFELTNVNAAGKLIRSSIHSFKTLP
jgi:hypothetical protein